MLKIIKSVFIFIFALILILPITFFNFKENCISQTDNRYLTNNPFGPNSSIININDYGTELSNYVNDRIGFRNEMIEAYNTIDAKFFQIMTHPFYMKGRDNYIFHRKLQNVEFSEYHEKFANMVIEINEYCKSKNVPFIFVFNPEKLAITTDKAPEWMNYNNDWVDKFLNILEDNDVPVVNNTTILKEKYRNNEMVFNKQHDAGHWNDLGAFYGVNNILSEINKYFPEVKLNEQNEFIITKETISEQQQAGVFVEEEITNYIPKNDFKNVTNKYKNRINLDKNYHHFYASINNSVQSPKTLVFQGSYMNEYGEKFMSNALREYYAVHDYMNIFNFEYYFEFFDPECVVFEVAEYTFTDTFFDFEKLQNFKLK